MNVLLKMERFISPAGSGKVSTVARKDPHLVLQQRFFLHAKKWKMFDLWLKDFLCGEISTLVKSMGSLQILIVWTCAIVFGYMICTVI